MLLVAFRAALVEGISGLLREPKGGGDRRRAYTFNSNTTVRLEGHAVLHAISHSTARMRVFVCIWFLLLLLWVVLCIVFARFFVQEENHKNPSRSLGKTCREHIFFFFFFLQAIFRFESFFICAIFLCCCLGAFWQNVFVFVHDTSRHPPLLFRWGGTLQYGSWCPK